MANTSITSPFFKTQIYILHLIERKKTKPITTANTAKETRKETTTTVQFCTVID